MRGSNPDLVPHPAAGQAAAHCQAVIAQSGPTENTVLYMLTMLRDILPALNKTATKSACETVLKLLTLGSSILGLMTTKKLTQPTTLDPPYLDDYKESIHGNKNKSAHLGKNTKKYYFQP